MKTRRRSLRWFVLIAVLLVTAGGLWLRSQQRQYARNRQLIAALVHKDTRQALALVNEGADPNTHFNPASAPTFKLLLRQFLHHKPPVDDSPTAFRMACGMRGNLANYRTAPSVEWEGKLLLLKAMLAHGANVHIRARYSGTPLDYAIVREQIHTVELLLQHGADANAQDYKGTTPLMWAAATGDVNVVHVLLWHGANPNIQDVDGNTSLHTTLFMPNANRVLSELLAHGADPNLRDKDGETPSRLHTKSTVLTSWPCCGEAESSPCPDHASPLSAFVRPPRFVHVDAFMEGMTGPMYRRMRAHGHTGNTPTEPTGNQTTLGASKEIMRAKRN